MITDGLEIRPVAGPALEEDGGLLSLIMPKALLPADDARITDRTIAAQLRRDA